MRTLIFLLFAGFTVSAQNVDYNKIILPDHAKTDDFGEKLVQIAWRNHPANQVYRSELTIADFDVRTSTVEWLNTVRVSANMNEFTLNPDADIFGRAAFYPRYNVGFSIALGQLFNIPYNTRKSKEGLKIAQANLNNQKLSLRNAVLRAYNEFLLREKIYKLQSQLLLDNETSHKLVEQRFKNGETTFEIYAESLSNYSQISINALEAETAFRNAKLDLEQFIGMRLEDVR